MNEKILDTARLSLRPFTEKDTSFIIQLVNSPGWLTFIGDKNIRNESQALDYLRQGPLKSYTTYGFGLWLVELKPDATPIGMSGLVQREYLTTPDLGFAFLPSFTGKGYAREIAYAILDYAKTRLGLETIQATTLPDNERSISLLQKIGMSFSETLQSPTNSTLLHLYHRSLKE